MNKKHGRTACDVPGPSAGGRGPISLAIFRVARAHKSLAGLLLADLGLFPGQELVLMILGEQGPLEQRELVSSLGTHPSTVTKMFQRLESAGLISRSRSATDRRALVVELTPAGKKLLPRLHDMWGELERLTLEGLSPNQQTQLVRVLTQLEETLTDSLCAYRHQ